MHIQSESSSEMELKQSRTINRRLVMIGYFFPVLMISLVMLLVNRKAVLENSKEETVSVPRLIRIAKNASNQTRREEKAQLDFIVVGFPKCVCVRCL